MCVCVCVQWTSDERYAGRMTTNTVLVHNGADVAGTPVHGLHVKNVQQFSLVRCLEREGERERERERACAPHTHTLSLGSLALSLGRSDAFTCFWCGFITQNYRLEYD